MEGQSVVSINWFNSGKLPWWPEYGCYESTSFCK